MTSATSTLGWLVLTPTSSTPLPKSASTSSQLKGSLRTGFSELDNQTRENGRSRPVMAPGLATWTVSMSPFSSTTSARNRLERRARGAGQDPEGNRMAAPISPPSKPWEGFCAQASRRDLASQFVRDVDADDL